MEIGNRSDLEGLSADKKAGPMLIGFLSLIFSVVVMVYGMATGSGASKTMFLFLMLPLGVMAVVTGRQNNRVHTVLLKELSDGIEFTTLTKPWVYGFEEVQSFIVPWTAVKNIELQEKNGSVWFVRVTYSVATERGIQCVDCPHFPSETAEQMLHQALALKTRLAILHKSHLTTAAMQSASPFDGG